MDHVRMYRNVKCRHVLPTTTHVTYSHERYRYLDTGLPFAGFFGSNIFDELVQGRFRCGMRGRDLPAYTRFEPRKSMRVILGGGILPPTSLARSVKLEPVCSGVESC